MPNYDLGRATGRIVIEYDDQGVGRAREDLASASEEAGSTGDKFDSAADKMGVAGLGIVAGFGLAAKAAIDWEEANSKLVAQLGLTTEETGRATEAAKSLFSQGFGESAEEVNGAIASVISSMDGMRSSSAETLEAVTKKVLNLASAFEIDMDRAAQVAGQAVKSGLVHNTEEALDLLTASMQKVPAAVREDILDAVDEYGPFMSKIGVTGERAFGLLVASAEKGAFGIDKTGDALKEFSIRATDMSAASKAGYDAIGLSQKKMSGELLKGGAEGEKAFQQIIAGLRKIKDPVKQSQAALALFGTPLEDLGVTEIPKFLSSLDGIQGGMGKTAGSADKLNKTLGSSTASSMKTAQRSLESSAIAFGTFLLPAIKKVTAELAKFTGWLNSLDSDTKELIVKIAGSAAGILLLAAAIVKTVRAVQTFIATMKVLAGAMHLSAVLTGIKRLGLFIKQLAVVAARATLTAGRLLLLGLRMAALGAGRTLVFLAQMARSLLLISINAARAGASMVLMAARTIAVRAALLAIRAATLAWTAAQWLLNSALFANPIGLVILAIIALVALFVILWKNSETFRNIVTGVWNAVWNVIRTVSMAIFNFVKNHWRLIISVVLGPLGIMIALVTKYWRQILSAITTVVKAIFNFLRNNWKTILAVITGPIGIAVLLISKNWKTIQTIFSNAFAVIRKMITAWVNAVKNNFTNMLSFIRGIPDRIKSIFNNAKNWLYNAGRNIIQGLINGALSILRNLWNVFSSITSRIPKIKGPESVDKKLLSPNGEWVMQSFLDGIKSKIPELESFLSRIGPVNVVGAMGSAAAQTASGAVRAFSPTLTPGSASQVGTGQISASDARMIADALTDAMERRGVGAAIIDGQQLQDKFGKNIGREAALRRRTG